jgi:hypothetical protein
MYNSASANKRTNEKMSTTKTTTTALWFHDADDEYEKEEKTRVMTNDDDVDDGYCCENCRIMDLQQEWTERQEFMHQHKYGVCMDCGVGLDYDDEFLVDRRETQCDCFTCNSCFTHFHGKDALHQAVHWKELGKPIPQFVRLSCLNV